jgi:hypothetical protein
MSFDMRGVDHLHLRGTTVASKLPEQVFPDAASRPARETVVDRRRRAVSFGAIAPAAAALKHMDNAADNAAIVLSFLAADFRRQMWLNALPLFVAQPK